MNGAQDLGGGQNFGPVVPEADEPAFHAPWERRVFAMAIAMGYAGAWSLDASRAARESMPPAQYLASSYYGIWLAAVEKQVAELALATPDEIAGGTASAPGRSLPRVLRPEGLEARFRAGFPSDREAEAPARFAVGDAVLTISDNPSHHTRLPRYARGRRGTIERVHGAFVFPDTNAHGQGEHPAWLYTVGFNAADLWGASADPGGRVTIAAFEPYLEPA